VVGYALPIAPADVEAPPGAARWRSGRWFLRPERMYLIPGDSAMGWRLPLDSLAWVTSDEFPYLVDVDPFAARPPLPSRWARITTQPRVIAADADAAREPSARRGPGSTGPGAGTGARGALSGVPPGPGVSAPDTIRTAVCVEPRDGTLHVFMPPLSELVDYLDLVAAIEETAAELEMPVLVEGYHPPSDPRLRKLEVTPDPGVIEVNASRVDWAVSSRATPCHLRGGRPADQPEKFMPTDATREPAAITSRSAARRRRQPDPSPSRFAEPARVLAQPPVAVLHFLRTLHRADQPGTQSGRSAQRPALRARDRVQAGARRAP
jgi:hypothetical protein